MSAREALRALASADPIDLARALREMGRDELESLERRAYGVAGACNSTRRMRRELPTA